MTKLRCGTMLRVFGKAFDARTFAKRNRLKTLYLWNRGESPVPEVNPLDHGGFMLGVSDAIDTHEQMQDTEKFLRRHRAKLAAIQDCRQVEEIWLEIRFVLLGADRITAVEVPHSVIKLASELGIKLEIIAVPRHMARLRK